MTRLLAIAASTRSDSLNRKLLEIAARHAEAAGAHVTFFDYAQCISPMFLDEDAPEPLPGIKRISDAIRAHDGILLASPEYNWSIPGHLKSLIDWLSVDPFPPLKGKSALLMCASPSIRGGILGLNQLSLPLNHLGMYVYPHLIAIGDAKNQLTPIGIANQKDADFLSHCVTDFVRVTNTSTKG